jgi:hypothetical protein
VQFPIYTIRQGMVFMFILTYPGSQAPNYAHTLIRQTEVCYILCILHNYHIAVLAGRYRDAVQTISQSDRSSTEIYVAEARTVNIMTGQ